MVRWRLKELAEPERWNPHNLAAATGLAYTTVYNMWENKTRRADLDTIGKLATALKVEPGALLVRVESKDTSASQDAYQAMRAEAPELGKDGA